MSDAFGSEHGDDVAANWPPLASGPGAYVGAPLAADLRPSGPPAAEGATGGPPPFDGRYPGGPHGPALPPSRAPRRGVLVAGRLAACALLIVVGVAIGHLAWSTSHPSSPTSFSFPNLDGPGSQGFHFPGFGQTPDPFGTTTPGTSNGGPSDVRSIAAKVDPALVDINSTFNYQDAAGEGTGIVLTSTGEVLTNNHVINGETSVSVTDVGNGKTYDAKVVGYDTSKDIAVLQLEGASGLAAASIGNSATATVGEKVVAIGNAGGLGGTPTAAGGEISGLNQSVTASDELDGTNEQLSGLIGTSADVQPGDSGGSLVNTSGQVLGIDTAGSTGSSFVITGQSTSTQAYAIPIDEALSIATQIESGSGTSTIHVGATAFLGVLISSSGQGALGVTIERTVSGGAAANAGLKAGDVITAFDGQALDTPQDLTAALVPLHPGDRVSIAWTDTAGHSHTAVATLASGPPA